MKVASQLSPSRMVRTYAVRGLLMPGSPQAVLSTHAAFMLPSARTVILMLRDCGQQGAG
jgi:hypothetical protein